MPDARELARLVVGVLSDAENVHEHRRRGLDHSARVPLKVMYPDADVPVLQLSIPTQDSRRLLALGERLRSLREHGVLVIGSGFLTHGLPFVDRRNPERVPGWSAEFDAWAADALARGDVDELAHFRTRAPACRTPTRPSSTSRRCSSPWARRPLRTRRSPRRSTASSAWPSARSRLPDLGATRRRGERRAPPARHCLAAAPVPA